MKKVFLFLQLSCFLNIFSPSKEYVLLNCIEKVDFIVHEVAKADYSFLKETFNEYYPALILQEEHLELLPYSKNNLTENQSDISFVLSNQIHNKNIYTKKEYMITLLLIYYGYCLNKNNHDEKEMKFLEYFEKSLPLQENAKEDIKIFYTMIDNRDFFDFPITIKKSKKSSLTEYSPSPLTSFFDTHKKRIEKKLFQKTMIKGAKAVAKGGLVIATGVMIGYAIVAVAGAIAVSICFGAALKLFGAFLGARY